MVIVGVRAAAITFTFADAPAATDTGAVYTVRDWVVKEKLSTTCSALSPPVAPVSSTVDSANHGSTPRRTAR